MKTFIIGNKYLLTGIFFFMAGVLTWLSIRKFNGIFNDNQLTAVGLRGTSKITKPLSRIQKNRLEKHFTTIPPAAHTGGKPGSQSPMSMLNEVQSINQFNQRQNQ